jgi:CRP/FNR family cyclic AMP-dependent transcriptional regulator
LVYRVPGGSGRRTEEWVRPADVSPLLSALSPDERDRLLSRAVVRRVEAGTVIYLEGDSEPRAHLIGAGVVKLSTRDTGGREAILGLALVGDLIGEIPVIDGKSQPTDALAVTGCELMGFESDLLRSLLAQNGRAALAVARSLSARLRWVSETALERTSSDVPARLAGRLLDLAELLGAADGGGEFDLPLVQADLGSMAGMSRESACKTLRSFKVRGLLEYSGRRIRILRPDLLELVRTGGAVAS